tara:strand:- start:659 stop:1264 length:606 start_codon:yes stop_codon:yes gene_type:complete
MKKLCAFSSHSSAEGRQIIIELIRKKGLEVIEITKKSDLDCLDLQGIDCLLSDRTNFIFPKAFLDRSSCIKINTHPSLLPFHKGSHPIFWACLLNHKLGVSINQIEVGIDTGDICYQQEVEYSNKETFRVIHSRCRNAILCGIENILEKIVNNENITWVQQLSHPDKAHKLKEAIYLLEKLPKKWDTSIEEARSILVEYLI